MGIIFTILTILDVLIAVLIIALVLVQQSKSTGLGTTFGGGGSDSLFGAHAATHLSKLTVIFSSLFLIITLALAIMSGHRSNYRQDSGINSLLTSQSVSTPANVENKAGNISSKNIQNKDSAGLSAAKQKVNTETKTTVETGNSNKK